MSLKDLYTSSSAYTPTPSDKNAKPTTATKKSGLSALLENTVTEQPTTTPKAQTQPILSGTPEPVQNQIIQIPTPAPKKTLFSKVADAYSAGVEKITGRPDYTTKPASNSIFKNTLRELPSAITETILPGVGAIRDNQDLVAEQNIGAKDLAKEVPGQVIEAGKQFIKAPISGALNLTMKPTTIKIPGLGDVSNSQYEVSKRIANGEDSIIATLSEGGNAVLNSLFFFGLASKAFTPRPSAISAKGEANVPKESGIPIDTGAKSFRLYEQPSVTKPIDPVTLKKIALENNIPISTDYNPKNPTYFKMSGVDANGKVTGQFFQLKPSYFDTFRNILKGDPNRVPNTQIIPIIEVKRDVAEIKNTPALKGGGETVPTVKSPLDVGQVAPETPTVAPETRPVPAQNVPTNLTRLAQEAGVSLPETSPVPVSRPSLPENGQVLPPAEMRDTPLIVKTGDYIVNRDGQIEKVTSGNSTSVGDSRNEGYIRSQTVGDTQDKLQYANQIRLATPEEIKQAKTVKAPQEKALFTPRKQALAEKEKTGTQLTPENTKTPYHVIIYDNKGKNPSYSPVPEGKKVEIDPNLDTFIHRPRVGTVVIDSSWVVSEGRSGMRIADGATQKQAIENAKEIMDRANKGVKKTSDFVNDAVNKYGISPKYAPAKKLFSQKAKVAETIKEKPKSIKEIAQETNIKEPNVRRILGVGAKDGTFARVDKGVYKLTIDGQDLAYIETGNAVDILPRLAKDGFKSDMVFLDIPYDTPAIKGGNRGMDYNLISVSEFGKILDSVKEIARTPDSPIIHMFSQAPSGMKAMQKYNDVFLEKGFVPVGKGELQKTFKTGLPVTNVRGEVSKPEGILVFNQSGKLQKDLKNLNFKLVRPKGYQSEKPAEMLKQMIEMTTNEGDVVLDPFAGSGVTGAEAVKAGRKAFLIEKNPSVAETVTKPRLESALPKKEPTVNLKAGEEASLASDFKEGKIAPATSPEELTRRIEQLNKFGQAHAILRRTGGLSKKTAGIFRAQRNNPNDRGTVHLQDYVVRDPSEYMSVLGHELGHAMEKAVTGNTNVDTYQVFGKNLSPEIKNKIKLELKAVTNEMEGEAKAKAGAGYYYKDTELLARFLQKMFESPGNLSELAPTAVEYFEQSAVENPIIGEYLDAVRGTIDKGERKTIFARDMKQTYQKVLGTRVGTMAWNDEVRYRAMKQRAIIQVEKLIKNKFKDVKDDPALLFQSAEAIKSTKGGVPEFGTRDFQYAKNKGEEVRLIEAGYKPIKQNGKTLVEIIDGEAYPRFERTRYTPEQGKALYDQLSPKGKELIKDFTSAKEEAKDYFNREMIKDTNKINSEIEGWVHHFWEDTGVGFGKNRLKTKIASAKKQRTGSEGYVQDLQKAMQKALTEIETSKAYNNFIDEYFARVTEPIAKGEQPKKGYVEVVGDVKKGGVGTSFENRTSIIQNGKSVPVQKPRYQMPQVIYERYKMIGELAKEASTAVEVMNSINRYWRVNILFHPGSAMTNFVSGGIQYSTKMLTDFYTEVLTGSLKMEKTRANVGAMLTVLTPKGWNDAPDWVYGGDLSNYYGEFMTGKTPGVDVLNKSVDAYADKALKFYGYVERYWKKVIATSENVGDLSKLNDMTKEGLRLPTAEEKQLLDEINSEIDLFAYDYDNVPVWLQNYSQNFFGQAIKPFAKYPYKYAKHVTEMATSIFDQTQPKQERMAKLLALGTIMALYAYVRSKRKKEQKTPEVPETAPTSVSTRGRLFIGTDEKGNEIFTRTAKYPFLNITEAGAQFIEGNSATGFQSITDMLGSVAPAGQLMASLFGYSNQFQMYTPTQVLAGQNLASFVPGTRILSDIARFFDPYQRKPTTFTQGFTSLIPLPSASEDLRVKLRGGIKTIQVPIEGNIAPTPGTKRTTIDQAVLNYKSDILYGLLGGIYRNRIDPETAKAFIIRKEKNVEKANKKAEKDAKTENKPVSLLKEAGNAVKSLFLPKTAYADTIANAKAEDLGLASVPKKWDYAMKDVYSRYPDVPKGMVETVLMLESSMGRNSSNKAKDYGEYGWLAGHTNNGTFKHLLDSAQKDPKLEANIKIFEKKNGKYAITNIKNLGDEYSAIQATGSVLANLSRNNPGLDPAELYFKKYVTAKASDTKTRRELFQKAYRFYSQKSLQ